MSAIAAEFPGRSQRFQHILRMLKVPPSVRLGQEV